VWLWNNLYLFAPSQATLPTHLSEKQCQALWNQLAEKEPDKANSAFWSFALCPIQAVPCLEKRLQPLAPIDQKIIAQAIADLADDRFQVRRAASAKLRTFGELVVPALHRRLQTVPPLEERQRIEGLLLEAKQPLSPDALRIVRAIGVLEYIGTPGAKMTLQRLAKGAADARTTQQAQSALRRLESGRAGGHGR